MNKKVILAMLVFCCLLTSVFALDSLSCRFANGNCDSLVGEVPMFYANGYFYPPGEPEKVLSSNVAIAYDPVNYNRTLCCKSDYGSLGTEFVGIGDSCTIEYDDLMYFTDSTNARAAFKNHDSTTSYTFNKDFYSKKLCVSVPSGFANLKMIASNKDYSSLGYTCMYKTSGLYNGHVSSCDATFNAGNSYGYTVWGKVFESTDTLNCNTDCVSILTNRVMYECREKLGICANVIIECDGALLGTWVPFNATHEVNCMAPWNHYRLAMFTGVGLEVGASLDSECDNLVKKPYNVLLNNEMVTLDVFICED